MRIIIDVSADADNRIQGTASWPDIGQPIEFSGWLALMRLVEQANLSRSDGGRTAELEHPGDEVVQPEADQ